MTERLRACSPLVVALLLACCGCAHAPGVPAESAEVVRPDQQLDFQVLYRQNCSGCHGDNGRGGAAIPLNNPAYLAVAGAQNLRTATATGMRGTMMPAFAQSSGGMLTDQQVDALVQGMLRQWGRPSDFAGTTLPSYSGTTAGNAADGEKVYASACARCHGADGAGIKTPSAPPRSIIDQSYLTLVSDQSLRSYLIAGHLDDNAPDWRSYVSGQPLTSQQITDLVAWIAAHRAPVEDRAVDSSHPSSTGVATKERP